MLSFSGILKVFVAVEPCDMRRSFDGLHNAVATLLGEDPKSGALFAFTNRHRSLHSHITLLFRAAGLSIGGG